MTTKQAMARTLAELEVYIANARDAKDKAQALRYLKIRLEEAARSCEVLINEMEVEK